MTLIGIEKYSNDPIGMIYPLQVRAARALLGINQRSLAEWSGVSIATIKRIEAAGNVLIGNAQTIQRLQNALEAAGVVFVGPSDGKGPGVRLAEPIDCGAVPRK